MENDDDFLASFSKSKTASLIATASIAPKKTNKKAASPLKSIITPQSDGSPDIIDQIINRKMSNPNPVLKKKEKAEKVEKEKDEPAYGNEANSLRKKITEYGLMFPDLTKSFIATINKKKNASVEDLKLYIEELDIICSVGTGVDGFIMDAFFSILEQAEVVTRNYKFSIVGLTHNLKENELFMNLAKRVYIKYSTFIDAPIEVQLVMSVVLTAYITIQTNLEMKNGKV